MDDRLRIEYTQGSYRVVLFTWCGRSPSFQVMEYKNDKPVYVGLWGDPDKARSAAAKLIASYYMGVSYGSKG